MTNRVAVTELVKDGYVYRVSTINRESSSPLAHGMVYAETIVWKKELGDTGIGDIVQQGEDPRDSIREHIRLVKLIHETGSCEEKDED